MGAQGRTTVDFGTFPGAADTSVDVVTAGVLSTSGVEAWLEPVLTADHSVDEHIVETIKVRGAYLSDGNLRIRAIFEPNLHEPDGPALRGPGDYMPVSPAYGPVTYGLWTVGWVWN